MQMYILNKKKSPYESAGKKGADYAINFIFAQL